MIATFWVLFVFTWGGQIVSSIDALFSESVPETILERTNKTTIRVQQAIENPAGNWRNIWLLSFIIMGVSASLPTVTHFLLFCRACLRSWIQNLKQPFSKMSNFLVPTQGHSQQSSNLLIRPSNYLKTDFTNLLPTSSTSLSDTEQNLLIDQQATNARGGGRDRKTNFAFLSVWPVSPILKGRK